MGQLIREDNVLLTSTFVYTYDDAGNILTKEEYSLTLTDALGAFRSSSDYTYSSGAWGDLLYFRYDGNTCGENIEYDTIGNPTFIGHYIDDEYDFHASIYLDWNGRELVSYESLQKRKVEIGIIPRTQKIIFPNILLICMRGSLRDGPLLRTYRSLVI